jgi:hypothetical protein
MCIRRGIYPFYKVINYHWDESMPLSSFRLISPMTSNSLIKIAIVTSCWIKVLGVHKSYYCTPNIYIIFWHVLCNLFPWSSKTLSLCICLAIICPFALVTQIPLWTSYKAHLASFLLKHLSKVLFNDLVYKISPSR